MQSLLTKHRIDHNGLKLEKSAHISKNIPQNMFLSAFDDSFVLHTMTHGGGTELIEIISDNRATTPLGLS